MQSKLLLIRSFFVVGIVGIAFSSISIFFLTFELLGQGSPTEVFSPPESRYPQNLRGASVESLALPEKVGLGLPIRLTIPQINVDASFEFVGLTPEGAMDVPKSPLNVAWFEPGPRPGEVGSAVVAGHYGRWENGRGSVFDDLHTLRKGDSIHIQDEKGETITFTVRELRTYAKDEEASEVFGSSDGKVHLNLVTCEGDWNKDQKSYPNRLVVFTDRAEE